MVKIFIGNLSQETEREEVEALFTPYGTVTECAKYKNFAFVHMEDRKSATKAIRELYCHKLNGRPINVELSRGNNQGPVKLHVANVEKGFEKELRELFEEYGTVTECAIVKSFAFVHMANSDVAMDALKGLDNTDFQGKRIHVQLSKSRPRGPPEDYMPPMGRGDYYPHYPGGRPEPPFRGHMPGYPPPPPPPPPPRRPMYPDRGYGVREHMGMGPGAPYERRPIPPPPPPGPYMARDRSPIRPSAPPSGNGYSSVERARLSPQPRPQMFPTPGPRDNFTEGPVPPPPPPPHFTGY